LFGVQAGCDWIVKCRKFPCAAPAGAVAEPDNFRAGRHRPRDGGLEKIPCKTKRQEEDCAKGLRRSWRNQPNRKSRMKIAIKFHGKKPGTFTGFIPHTHAEQF
jgi:hypothetical protein